MFYNLMNKYYQNVIYNLYELLQMYMLRANYKIVKYKKYVFCLVEGDVFIKLWYFYYVSAVMNWTSF